MELKARLCFESVPFAASFAPAVNARRRGSSLSNPHFFFFFSTSHVWYIHVRTLTVDEEWVSSRVVRLWAWRAQRKHRDNNERHKAWWNTRNSICEHHGGSVISEISNSRNSAVPSYMTFKLQSPWENIRCAIKCLYKGDVSNFRQEISFAIFTCCVRFQRWANGKKKLFFL